ncbi:hypothetical protein DIPPA_08164 [Diplonema papillatum]|nr:hypothetical protein DIPPA_35556 [Diplonema papillatum]KAJ9447112.1 hypothetical protein DIPPA_08165 [Diplonema papillatum]KAJ9447113.1 hypothetical protein DIPPA_08156 [Diplonema papillatum]KAJ9447115.1 hypothetical protein DIPPA_08164 [Diplonema papillatum]
MSAVLLFVLAGVLADVVLEDSGAYSSQDCNGTRYAFGLGTCHYMNGAAFRASTFTAGDHCTYTVKYYGATRRCEGEPELTRDVNVDTCSTFDDRISLELTTQLPEADYCELLAVWDGVDLTAELKAQVYKSNDCSGIPITSSDSSGSSSDSSGSDATASDPDEAKDVERHTETCVGCCYEGESASGAVYKKAYMSCHEGKVVTSEATYTNDPACSSGNQTDTSVSVFNGRCLEMDSPVLGIQSMKLHVGDAVTAAICKTVDLASKHPDFGRANIVGYDEMVAQLPFTAQAVKAQGGGESASLPAVSVLLGVLALAATLL